MAKISTLRGLCAMVSAALTLGALQSGASQAAVDPAAAGQIRSWSNAGYTDYQPLPAAIEQAPIAQVDATGVRAVFLTAAGKILMRSDAVEYELPAALQDTEATFVAASGSVFGAVTSSGSPVFWGAEDAPARTVGEVDVSNLAALDFGGRFGVGLKQDGTVVAWGENTNGETAVPPALSGVTKVTAGTNFTLALKSDGTVTGWGQSSLTALTQMPAALSVPGQVKDVEARASGGLALLTNGTVLSWGAQATSGVGLKYNLPPASLSGKTITKIAAKADYNVAIDSDGGVTVWGTTNAPTDVPSNLNGQDVSSIVVTNNYAYAVQSKVMQITGSSVSGTAKQGQTLTGTPATFSGGPEVSYQWLTGTTPIEGATATSLTLTAAQVGKQLTFRTIATKNGESLTSDSPATASVAPATVPKVTSRTTISKVKVKRKTAAFSVKVTRAGGTPTGKVKVLVKRGAKKVYSKTLILKSGVAKVSLKRLKKGKHKITATYAGDSRSKPSTAKAQTFRVK